MNGGAQDVYLDFHTAPAVQCCFESTETTLKIIRDGEPRTSTSTFAQLLASDPDDCSVLLYVHTHRGHKEDRTITNYAHSLIVLDTFFLRARIDYISSASVFALLQLSERSGIPRWSV